MIEIRWHGRGGQGAVTSAEIVALAAINEERYAMAFPSFGPERRGAPVLAFLRINDDEPVKIRAEITEPDVVVVLDPGLLNIVDVTSGLKNGGILIINSSKNIADMRQRFKGNYRLAIVDATKIARELLGVPITNTTMIGALIKTTGAVKLESIDEPIQHRFGRIADRNISACRTAYEQTVVEA